MENNNMIDLEKYELEEQKRLNTSLCLVPGIGGDTAFVFIDVGCRTVGDLCQMTSEELELMVNNYEYGSSYVKEVDEVVHNKLGMFFREEAYDITLDKDIKLLNLSCDCLAWIYFLCGNIKQDKVVKISEVLKLTNEEIFCLGDEDFMELLMKIHSLGYKFDYELEKDKEQSKIRVLKKFE